MSRLALCALALAVAACDADFDPIEPSDATFSMYGYLDASADTQWVRVEPFGRTAAERAPGPIDADVALVSPDGARAPLRQRVVTFDTGPAHLFWTTADVAPGRTYRVVARRPDGAETTATVPVPSMAGVRVDVEEGPVCPVRVTVTGAGAVADVRARYRYRTGERVGERSFTHVFRAEAGGGVVQVSVYPAEDLSTIGAYRTQNPARLLGAHLTVAVATADWPTDVAGMSLEDRVRYRSPLVEGGVGFVGGVVTQTAPFTWNPPCRAPRRSS